MVLIVAILTSGCATAIRAATPHPISAAVRAKAAAEAPQSGAQHNRPVLWLDARTGEIRRSMPWDLSPLDPIPPPVIPGHFCNGAANGESFGACWLCDRSDAMTPQTVQPYFQRGEVVYVCDPPAFRCTREWAEAHPGETPSGYGCDWRTEVWRPVAVML